MFQLKDHISQAITAINSLDQSLQELQSATAFCSSFFIERLLAHLVSCETLPAFTSLAGASSTCAYSFLDLIFRTCVTLLPTEAPPVREIFIHR